jgi:uncharacterized protein YxjI
MKLLFKQRLFSWFDSYDIYDEHGETLFTVKGQLAWGHTLHISDKSGMHIATLKQRVLTFLPKFDIYLGDQCVGSIMKQFTLFKPSFSVDCNGWHVEGNFWEWDYKILSGNHVVATIEKQLLNWTDTYIIDIGDGNDCLMALMVVLAIDAVKCSQDN